MHKFRANVFFSLLESFPIEGKQRAHFFLKNKLLAKTKSINRSSCFNFCYIKKGSPCCQRNRISLHFSLLSIGKVVLFFTDVSVLRLKRQLTNHFLDLSTKHGNTIFHRSVFFLINHTALFLAAKKNQMSPIEFPTTKDFRLNLELGEVRLTWLVQSANLQFMFIHLFPETLNQLKY